MIEIIPAILPKNYEDLKNKIAIVRGIVPMVQVDICDGIFTNSRTWPFLDGTSLDEHFTKILNEEEGMPFWEDIDFELDLMVSDAVTNFDVYSKLGAKRIIFHIEAVGDLNEFKDFIEGIDMYVREAMEIGIALNIKTPIEDISPLVSSVDFIQCMGSDEIGHQGVSLDEEIFDKVKFLREKYSDIPIAVDIGVNLENAFSLIDSGVTKLVAGSAIFNTDDVIGRIEEFKNLE